MAITINIPPEFEEDLRRMDPQIEEHARDQLLVAYYQAGKLSRYKIQKLLGFDNRWETERWLGAHGAHLDYTLADLEADRRTLDETLGPVRS